MKSIKIETKNTPSRIQRTCAVIIKDGEYEKKIIQYVRKIIGPNCQIIKKSHPDNYFLNKSITHVITDEFYAQNDVWPILNFIKNPNLLISICYQGKKPTSYLTESACPPSFISIGDTHALNEKKISLFLEREIFSKEAKNG